MNAHAIIYTFNEKHHERIMAKYKAMGCSFCDNHFGGTEAHFGRKTLAVIRKYF